MLNSILEETLKDTQYGFEPNREVNDANFILRQISENGTEEAVEAYLCFTDIEKAFYRVN